MDDIKGYNVEIGADSSKFDEEIKNCITELKKLQPELSKINSQIKLNPTSVNLWKEKQSLLNKEIVETQKKLELQNQKLEQARKLFNEGTIDKDVFKQVNKSVKDTEKSLNKLNDELLKCNDRLEKLPYENMGRLGSTLTKKVTVPLLAAVSALEALGVSAANEIDEIGDAASKIGMSTSELYKWNYASEILAVDSEQLQKSFTKLNVVLGDIAAGTESSSIINALSQIGLTIEDLRGKNVNDAFKLIRNNLSKLEDSSLRVAIANEIFGDKLGTELQQLLSASSEEIDRLNQNIEKLGVATDEQAQVAGQLTDKFSDLKYALKSAKYELAEELTPTIESAVDYLINTVIPQIKEIIGRWNELSEGQQKFIIGTVAVVAALGPVLSIVSKIIPVLKASKLALVGIGEGGIFAGIGINAATLGIGTLIAILVMALMRSKEFREALSNIGNTLASVFTLSFNLLQPLIDILTYTLIPLLDYINATLAPILEGISYFAQGIGAIATAVNGVLPWSNTTNNTTSYTSTNNNSFSFVGYDYNKILQQINAQMGGLY